MFRLKRHCYINRNHNNKNWTYLFQTYVEKSHCLFWFCCMMAVTLRALRTRSNI